MEAECAASPVHRTKAIESALLAFIENQKKSHDSHFLSKWPVKISEPLPHIIFSEDAKPDLGPGDAPDPRDRERYEAWEKAEKARAARKLGLSVGMVDFTITARFRRKMRQAPLLIAPGAATNKSPLVVAK